MNVWKIASRWSYTGTKESSILDIFRKYGIVFAGKKTEKIILKSFSIKLILPAMFPNDDIGLIKNPVIKVSGMKFKLF